MKNPYQPIEAVIEEIIQETPTIRTFVLKPKELIEFKTGQFVELSFPGVGEAPFTPSSNPNIKERLDLTIMNVGRLTQFLHTLSKDTILGIRGPYGNGYPIEEFEGKEILIVGGGVGLAPLRSLILALFSKLEKYKKIFLCYGARTPKDLLYKDQILQWQKKIGVRITVDTGDESWKGNVGLVTSILKDLPLKMDNAVAVVCGPPIMMKFTTLRLLELGFKPKDIYLSMEKNMSCGLGKCGHCRMGKYYVCRDGPVFCFEEIKDIHDIWE
ncbi:MAG: FAD/NAD(P)-binding protein [Candidatus Omnitrophica bacterium]|nr:FAD/NAD(P)-binding protein [Candidatus Omnitrophota bacterium]MCM8793917.1 FAD/NAD(P)-binding protein [Candidatus Omnitrophota bacterium]